VNFYFNYVQGKLRKISDEKQFDEIFQKTPKLVQGNAQFDILNKKFDMFLNLFTNFLGIMDKRFSQIENLDKDGDLDIFAGSYDSNIYWYENGNNWNRTTIGTESGEIRCIAVGDLSNDEDLDVVITSYGSPTSKIYSYNSTTKKWTVIGYPSVYSEIILADVDNDNDLDIVNIEPGISLYTKIYWANNTDNGTSWNNLEIGDCTYMIYDIEIGDIDSNNNINVVATTSCCLHPTLLFQKSP